MDGWSAPILVRELLQAYAQRRQRGVAAAGDAVPRLSGVHRPAGPCGGACGLAGQPGRARGGHPACGCCATGAAAGGRRGQPLAPEQIELSLGEALSAALNRTAREQALTLNTLLQAAWGILLGRLTGRDDVVFGVTVAGRPAELAGVEQHGGPVHQHAAAADAAAAAAAAVGAAAADPGAPVAADRAPALGLAEIQQAAGVGELFDTLMVFENYPVDRDGLAAQANGLRLGRVDGP